MNIPGISNPISALTGGAGPTPNPARQQTTGGFNQILTREVSQRQAAPEQSKAPAQVKSHAPEKSHAPDKQKASDQTKVATSDAPKPEEAAAAKGTAPDAAGSKLDDSTDAKDAVTNLADIPGAPQAALIMNLMALAPAAPAAPDAASVDIDGTALVRSDLAGRQAGKANTTALDASGAVAAQSNESAGEQLPDLGAAFGKLMDQAGQQREVKALIADKGESLKMALAAPQEDRLTGAQAALASLQPTQITQAATGHADRLAPAVGTPAWDQALGQKIVWMAKGGEQTATLTMNPPDLGPLQVVLSVTDNQAMVNFTAAQPEVREALETALPRLQEMLKESGIQLGQANVNAGTQQQFAAFSGSSGQGSGSSHGTPSDPASAGEESTRVREGIVRIARNGAVDTFA